MADVHTPETRSYNMSKIRGRDTKPEEILRKGLFTQGFRYRKTIIDCRESQIWFCQNTER